MSKPDTFLAGDSLLSRAFYRFGWLVVVPILFGVYTRLTDLGSRARPCRGCVHPRARITVRISTPRSWAPCRWKRMRYMGKDTMWKHPRFGWVLSALGAFPVTRGTADREALKRAIAVLEMGEPLVLFPEGERKAGCDRFSPCSTARSTSRSAPACRSCPSASAGVNV